MRMSLPIGVFLAALVFAGGALRVDSQEKGLSVARVRYFSYPTFTRIVFEIETAAPYVLTRSGDGRSLVFAAYEGGLKAASPLPSINDGVVRTLELKQDDSKPYISVGLDAAAGDVKDFVLRSPDRIVLDVARGRAPEAPARPDASPSTVIVLDPGHGGKDAGIVTAQGQEKSRALEMALALRKLIKKKSPQLAVLLTREKDQTLALDERAAMVNAAGSSAFVCLHAAPGKDIRVFILEPDTEPAPRQTPAVQRDFLGFEAASEHQEALWGRQQAAHLAESGRLGRKLARQVTGTDNAEPIQAPLALFKAIDAPAVMVEIGMEQDRHKAMESLAKGIEQYARGIR